MTRSIFAGCTDYSYQSFNDMLKDLNDWFSYLKTTITELKSYTTQLTANGYFDNVDYNFWATVANSMKFYETSKTEIHEILRDLKREVRQDHVTRLRNLGKYAHELSIDYHQTFHKAHYNDYPNPYRKDENILLLQKCYQTGNGTALSMIDLDNLGARLSDFVGKKGEYKTRLSWLSLNPNFYGIGIKFKELPIIKRFFN